MKQTAARAFKDTIPVLTGYISLGIGFGVLLKTAGYGLPVAFLMSFAIYAGALQYVAVGLLSGGASMLTVAVTAFMVNFRHLFYGLSLIEKYRDTGKYKPYLALSLTDETYSLMCADHEGIPEKERTRYYFLVSLFDQIYWVGGSCIGSLLGSVVRFNTEGIDFALSALFITIFVDQWMKSEKHLPAIIGVGVSAICLIIFGSDNFLIPAMIIITLALLSMNRKEAKSDE